MLSKRTDSTRMNPLHNTDSCRKRDVQNSLVHRMDGLTTLKVGAAFFTVRLAAVPLRPASDSRNSSMAGSRICLLLASPRSRMYVARRASKLPDGTVDYRFLRGRRCYSASLDTENLDAFMERSKLCFVHLTTPSVGYFPGTIFYKPDFVQRGYGLAAGNLQHCMESVSSAKTSSWLAYGVQKIFL